MEGEIPAEIDYNEEAQKNADKDIPDHIPTDGYYLKATNANKEASQADKVGWYVAGAFRANRIMSDKETRDIIDEWNAAHPDDNVEYDWKRESGKDFNAETMSLEDTPKFSLKVYHGSGADFTEFDFDHMGEGAGSQAFGWGGYVTSSEEIGKSYANLSRDYGSRNMYKGDVPLTKLEKAALSLSPSPRVAPVITIILSFIFHLRRRCTSDDGVMQFQYSVSFAISQFFSVNKLVYSNIFGLAFSNLLICGTINKKF